MRKIIQRILLESIMDDLLDKISQSGLESLTPVERNTLDRLSSGAGEDDPEDKVKYFLEKNYYDLDIQTHEFPISHSETWVVSALIYDGDLIGEFRVSRNGQDVRQLNIRRDFVANIVKETHVPFKVALKHFKSWLGEKLGKEVRVVTFF